MTMDQYRKYLEKSFDAFCKTVIRNEAINLHRQIEAKAEKEQPLSTLSNSELAQLYYEDVYRPYRRIYYVHDQPIIVYNQPLGEALQFLTPRRRDVILLKYFLEYSDAEIARLLHISSPTVNERKMAALKKLKDLLEGIEDV